MTEYIGCEIALVNTVLMFNCLTAHQRIYTQMDRTVSAFVFPTKTGPHSSFKLTDLGGMEGYELA